MPVIHEITDLTAPELDIYARLTQAQLRNRLEPEKGIFIASFPTDGAQADHRPGTGDFDPLRRCAGIYR